MKENINTHMEKKFPEKGTCQKCFEEVPISELGVVDIEEDEPVQHCRSCRDKGDES